MDRAIEKKTWTTRKLLLIVGLPVLLLVLALWVINQASTTRHTVSRSRLQVSRAAQGAFQERIPISGEVLPQRRVYITAVEGGQVKALYLEGGEQVTTGQALLKLTNPGLELNYMNLQTNLLEQADQLRNTRITMENTGLQLRDQLIQIEYMITDLGQQYERNRLLVRDSVISLADFQTIENNYRYQLRRRELMLERISRDSLLTLQQLSQVNNSLGLVDRNLEAIKQSLDNMTIKAPVSGLMSALRVEVGENVTQGQTLCQIDLLESGFMVRARVDEHYNGRVFEGQEGTFQFNGTEHRLQIRKVYEEVVNGTFEVDMEFVETPPADIKRGQNLQIRLALSDETQALLISRGGFFQSSGGRYVYVLDASGKKAVRRTISIGRQSDEHYEILSGLEPGEELVTSSYESFAGADELTITD